MTTDGKPTGQPSAFATTQWTRVLQARGNSEEATSALSDLCEAYYKPVFAFIRRNSLDEEKARDLTQEFFARLLQRHSLGNVSPTRGRFRSYLLTSVKNFLNDMRDHDKAAKRNPGAPLQPIHPDTNSTSAGFDVPDPATIAPDLEFDRKWALALLDRALQSLAAEHTSPDKLKVFQTLKPWLTGDTDSLPQSTAAATLGLNDSAIKVAIHRLRRRFRDCVKNEIAATLPEPDPALVTDEMSYLVSILR
jgi:RNA polymerase sigma factor (sigma-70 family)